jgi:hypothetical protein
VDLPVKAYRISTLWEGIFESDQDILDDPSRLGPGEALKILTKKVATYFFRNRIIQVVRSPKMGRASHGHQ